MKSDDRVSADMSPDARQLPDLIRYLEGMNDHAVPAREDVLRYLRELEGLRAENVRLQNLMVSNELITRELQARLVTLEGEDMRRDRKRDELLCVATKLAAGWCGNSKAHNPMSGGVEINQNNFDWVWEAKRLIAAVDAACADHIADAGKLMGEAKAYVEVMRRDDGIYFSSNGSAFDEGDILHGHLIPAEGE